MATTDRPFDRGSRRGLRSVRQLGEEYRDQRWSLGLSQDVVAAAARTSRSRISRIEWGKIRGLSILEASRIAAVLGLDLSVRAFPGGRPLRDAAHAQRLRRVLDHVHTPLSYRTEVPLAAPPGHPEQRAWDAMILGSGLRTGIELEMRLRDAQALERRINLKRRDDPVDRFLLLVADTRTNRRLLAEYPQLFPDLPRLRRSAVISELQVGDHPRTGLVMI